MAGIGGYAKEAKRDIIVKAMVTTNQILSALGACSSCGVR